MEPGFRGGALVGRPIDWKRHQSACQEKFALADSGDRAIVDDLLFRAGNTGIEVFL